jgi:hypothetical protein
MYTQMDIITVPRFFFIVISNGTPVRLVCKMQLVS